MRKKLLIVLVLIVVLVCAFLVRVAIQPAPGRPNISITFLGYTNDSIGTRLARFAVTNLNPYTIQAYRPCVEIPAPIAPKGTTYDPACGQVSWNVILAPGHYNNLTVPLSTNQSPWRLSLLVYPDVGTTRVIKRILSSIGAKPNYQTMPYEIEGYWIQ